MTTVRALGIHPTKEGIVRGKRSTTICPGIGWERRERRPSTIGGRSERWRSSLVTAGLGAEDGLDEDTVIVRGRD